MTDNSTTKILKQILFELENLNSKDEEVWDVDDLARFLRRSRRQVFKFLNMGLPYIAVDNKKMFLKTDVIKWLRKHKIGE